MNIIQNQRGAMFGVDARLGLMIFGVLSIVAGYYGFSQIKMAKDAALLRDLSAMEEALAGYQADMGTFYLFTIDNAEISGETADMDLTALWDKSKVKPNFQHLWNGPYLQNKTLTHRTFGRWGMSYGRAEREQYCNALEACYVWLSLTKVPAPLWRQVNSYLDEDGGRKKEEAPETMGRVQASSALNDERTLYIRTLERQGDER